MLVELSVWSSGTKRCWRWCKNGWKVTEFARYERVGLSSLADRSRRPSTCPHQTDAEFEATPGVTPAR